MGQGNIKRNRPVAMLLKQFCNKKSKRVSEARKELQKRFLYLDWTQQKKIIQAHLLSTKADRYWIYPKMLSLWDKSFKDTIQALWEEYHEERCSWLVIRYLPIEYIMEHFDELSFGRNYFFICLRLGNHTDFTINKLHLQPLEYIYLVHHFSLSIATDEAMEIMYQLASEEITNPHPYMMVKPFSKDRIEELSILNVKTLNQAYYYFQKIGIVTAIEQIQQWDEDISNDLKGDLLELKSTTMSDQDFNCHAYSLLLQAISHHLPSQYHSVRTQQLLGKNEAFRLLTEKFSLEEINTY